MNTEPPVILITGAGKGAGRRAARAFASRGASLALNDIAPNNLDSLLEECQGAGCAIRTYVEDVARRLSAQALVSQVLEDWGRIDVLLNHAAVEPGIPLLDMDDWDWQRTLDVNLTGAFMMTQLVGRLMRSQEGGVIINFLSLTGQPDDRSRAAYLTSQMGLIGFTRQASRELFSYGIRVHAVGQGILPFQNAGDSVPHELERALLFLSGPQAAGMTGMIVETA